MKKCFFPWVFLFIFLLFIPVSFALNCQDVVSSVRISLNEAKKAMKESRDISNYQYHALELVYLTDLNCSLDKIFPRINSDLEKMKNYILDTDQSANLEKAKCTSVNLDTSHFPKNNDQADLPWCWAWAAANSLSYREKKAFSVYDIVAQSLSNLEIQHAYKRDPKKTYDYTNLEIGSMNTHNALIAMRGSKQLCLEKDFNFFQNDWVKLNELVGEVIRPQKNLVDVLCNQGEWRFRELGPFTEQMLSVIGQFKMQDRLDKFIELKCAQPRVSFNKDYNVFLLSRGENVTSSTLLNELDKNLALNIPINIGYDLELIKRGAHYKSRNHFNHFSTIIAREFNPQTKQCEYLIKNSWGNQPKGCSSLSSIRCDGLGNIWVPRTALGQNLGSINWIK